MQLSDSEAENKSKTVNTNQFLKNLIPFDELIDRAAFLESCNDKFSADNFQLYQFFYQDMLKAIKQIKESIIVKFDKGNKKIKKVLTTIRNLLQRIRMQHEAIHKLLEDRKHPKFKVRSLNNSELNYIRNAVNKSHEFQSKLIINELGKITRSVFQATNRRVSLLGNKMIFRGEEIKEFKQTMTILHTSKLYPEACPNMLASFKGTYGESFIAFINNKDFSIEFINISYLEKFKPIKSVLSFDDIKLTLKKSKTVKAPILQKNNINNANNTNNINESNKKNKKTYFLTFGTEVIEEENYGKKKPKEVKLSMSRDKNVRKGSSSKSLHAIKGVNQIVLKAQRQKLHHSISAHSGTIYGLRQYKMDRQDVLMTFSEDKCVKLWSCELMQCISTIFHEESVRCAILIRSEEKFYVVMGAFVLDYPLSINYMSGAFAKELPIKGFTYNLDSYTNTKRRVFLFVSTGQPYMLSVYDFEKLEKIYTLKTTSYVHNIIVTPFITPLVTYVDRSGIVTQIELETGKKIREVSGYGCYGVSKWNEKYYIFCGKGLGFVVVDINDFSIIKEYQNIHADKVKNLIKFKHKKYGDILITLGQDQKIKVFK